MILDGAFPDYYVSPHYPRVITLVLPRGYHQRFSACHPEADTTTCQSCNITVFDICDIIHAMKNEHPEHEKKASDSHLDSSILSGEMEPQQERLERVEAALRLLLDHTRTSTKASEVLESNHSRDLLSSIAFGFSAVALIAMWTIDLAVEDSDIKIIEITVALSLFLLASAVDLLSGSLLRKAVQKAIVEKEPSRLVIWQGSWHRLFKISYWRMIRLESDDFYYQQITRCASFTLYLLAGAVIVSLAMFSI